MIVLNEKEYAEECLKKKSVDNKPYFTLLTIAKYYHTCLGYKRKKIIELLTDFLSACYPKYECNKTVWNENIETIAKNAGKYKLYEIDGIWITENELKTIDGLHNKVLERLAFTLLCLAKLGNIKNKKNNGWVNYDAKEIFTLARISCSVANRYERLGKLHELSLLEFPRRIDNLSCRVTYIDDDSERKLFISDFRELGYEYLKYKGENYIRCCECGRLTKNNKYGNKKYCSDCAGYVAKPKYKTCVCEDCQKEFLVPSNVANKTRCNTCQAIRNNQIKRRWKESNASVKMDK